MKTITAAQMRHHWKLYLLLVPTFLLIGLFAYFPVISGIYHSFYRWNGDDISEFVGLENFRKAIADPVLIKSFGVVMIFIAANLVKMIPSIATAVVIHRMLSDRAKYLYRVAFVIPMVIPAMVWLLVWKYFYDPNYGILNATLNATGAMNFLSWADKAAPVLAGKLAPVISSFVNPVFGSVWGMVLFGVLILCCVKGVKKLIRSTFGFIILLAAALLLFGSVRAVVLLGICAIFAHIALKVKFYGPEIINWTGWTIICAAILLILLGMVWTEPTGAFESGRPTWLSHPKLVLPAMVFWGFPWVGVVSVLLYLSGLNNIDSSIYEAADIDGCGWFGKFLYIELPLITTQVRLNLVLMIIATLKGWGHIFIVLGNSGGPGGKCMLPGLYMFRQAFNNMQAGYACAIGLLLFGLILFLTVINNKYVRVEK